MKIKEIPEIQNTPTISVVMPTYNDGPYLKEAIDSILNQTFIDFEFIIINDGSTDNTEEIIFSYNDNRIRYLKNEMNAGNAVSRNKGMEAAKGKYIAVMDSDDISVPERLEVQYKYLEKHIEIGILGGSKFFFNEHTWFRRLYPTNPDYIKSFLFFKNPVGQPTVIMRREIIDKAGLRYEAEFENGEDYDFWYRAAIKGVLISNLEEVMLYYRQSETQMSHPLNGGGRIVENSRSFFRDKLLSLGIELDHDDFITLHKFINGRVDIRLEQYRQLNQLLKLILDANRQRNVFNDITFRAVIFAHRLRLIKYSFLEKGKLFDFACNAFHLVVETGFLSIGQYWKNEARFGRNFGANKVHASRLHLPGQ